MDRRRSRRAVVSSVAMLMLPLACSEGRQGDTAPEPLEDDAITVGSFDFDESMLVAEIYSQALEAKGFEVQRAFSLGPREFLGPALRSGLVEFVPEYAGTALDFISLGEADPSDDAAGTHAQLQAVLRGSGIRVLDAAPAQNANVFVVTRATAGEHDLQRLSDLIPLAEEMTFGGPPECASRRLCLGGLRDVYDVRFGEVLTLDASGPLTRQALDGAHIDVGLMFSTDPALAGGEYVVLEDDHNLQPAENITPLVRAEVVERWGNECTDVIDAVSARLTSATMQRLNVRISDDAGPDAMQRVAADWLQSEGLS